MIQRYANTNRDKSVWDGMRRLSINGWTLRRSYRSLNAIQAQLKNCHLELLLRLSCKIERLHPTIQADC
jgi:hypothetical protein